MSQINLGKTPSASAIIPVSGRCGIGIDENNLPYLITDTGEIIPLGESALDQNILDALANAESPTGDNPFVTIQQLQSFLGTSTILLYGGSAQWSGTGLDFIGSPSGYLIENVLYEIGEDTITSDSADTVNDRRDTFKLTASGWDIETGTPSAVPIAPTVNPITEIGLKDVLIEANATTPSVDEENVYLENTEWATSSSGAGTFNPASTNEPFAGSVAFESTNIQNGSRYIFTRASDIDLTNFDSIGLRLYLKSTMNNGRNFGIQFLDNSDNAVSNIIPLPISKSLDLAYQFVSLELSQFVFSSRTNVRKIHIIYYGSGGSPTFAGAYVDNVIIQGGFGVPVVFDGVESVTGLGVNNADTKNPVIEFQEASELESNTVLFDKNYIIGNAGARSGNILFDFTGAKLGATTRMLHTDASAWIFDTAATIRVLGTGEYSDSEPNIIWMVLTEKGATAADHVIEVTFSQFTEL
jgi:hypothetical protein